MTEGWSEIQQAPLHKGIFTAAKDFFHKWHPGLRKNKSSRMSDDSYAGQVERIQQQQRENNALFQQTLNDLQSGI